MRRAFLGLYAFALSFTSSAADRGAELAAVVQAERDFSARAQVVNARQAFAEFFASDAILFGPYPEPAFPGLAEAKDWPVNIQWRPTAAAISGAGDLGLSAGPAEYRKTSADAPHAFSHYSSIWERQPDGRYKVAIDIGVSHGGPVSAIPDWLPPTLAPRALPAVSETARRAAYRALVVLDQALGEAAAGDTAGAISRALANDGRYHVDGALPAVGRQAAFERLRASGMTQRWAPMGGKIAQSADFGFTYGKGTYTQPGAAPVDGELVYLNVWQKRGADWKLLLRVVNPIRPPAKAQG